MQKAQVYVFDNNQEKLLEFLKNNTFVKGLTYQTEYQIKQFNLIVVSPGVNPNNNIVSIAKYCEVPLVSDIELLYLFKKNFLIGITGSNGKTTTCTLLNEILKEKYKVDLCGNIGKPAIENWSQQHDALIVETSSFQLEYLDKLRYNISVILNLHENHLDWHFNFEEYCTAKTNIFKNSKKSDYLILNADDKNIKKLNIYKTKAKVLWFSTKKECKGIYIEKNNIILNINKKEVICNLNNINLIGEHNLQNILVSVLVAKLLNINNKVIEKTIKSFKAPEHRLEKFYSFYNVDCFNDSKSTTIQSTLSAIKALKNYNIILLLGGSSKNLNFDMLSKNLPQNVKQILVFGETQNEISKSLNKYNVNHIVCSNINNAILSSVTSSLSLDVVNDSVYHKNQVKNKTAILFSPACASFDSFNSFEERGIYFKEYLKSCVEDILK